MTSKERVYAAIHFKKVDYIPVFGNKSPMGPALIGRKLDQNYFLDADAMTDSELAMFEAVDDDVICLNLAPATQDALGAHIHWPENDHPQFESASVATLEDVEKIDFSDALDNEFVRALLETTRKIKKAVGETVTLEVNSYGVFNFASRLLGFDPLMLATVRNKELVHKVCDKIADLQVYLAQPFVDAGADLLSIGDGTSSPSCISSKIYGELALPYLTKTIQGFKKTGAMTLYHPCGGEYPIIDQVGKTGADVLYFSELVDLDVAQKIFIRRHAVAGGVDPTNTLFLGNPESIDENIKQTIGKLKHKTGVIIQPGCGLSPNIPIENLQAMVKATRKYSALM
ncbi:MAG: uroporphyrinogen decarboxylase family protein [Clostridiales Family XIII bacterium]|jgi:uroporphyrinogen decarboxylase|nr:uroporphyrinogen decarboxylase family protein [Clostridiales Family XIII bacterium]